MIPIQATSDGGGSGGVLGAVLLVLFGLALVWGGYATYRSRRREVARGRETIGRVRSSEAVRDEHREGGEVTITYYPAVEYEYEVGDREYTGSRIWPGHVDRWNRQETGSRRFAERWAERFPSGSRVVVHVDPDDPSRAFLVPRSARRELVQFLGLSAVGLVLLALGAVGFLASAA